MLTTTARKQPFFRTLYFRVIVGVVAGVVVGIFWPNFGRSLKPLGDGFISLVRMTIAPIVFLSVLVGIASVGDLRKMGRIGLKALVYFEVVTTFALLLGLGVASVIQPGRGMNVNVNDLNSSGVAQYTAASVHSTPTGFLLGIIPDTFVGAFSKGDIIQVLFLAILCGIALTMVRDNEVITKAAESVSHIFYKVIAIIMEVAPFGAFGAMAFTIGQYGVVTLFALGKLLLCIYLTSIGFILIVLGGLCLLSGISFWRFVVYLREEVLIVLGTSSSEPALPGMLIKMENLGCSRAVTGLVIPAGYSFNLDGTSIYLTISALFIAQATNTHLTFGQKIFILLVLMLNSKGAAAVTGGGFITLAGTLSAVGTIPVAGLSLLLGVDRFMSQMRSLTNLIGNGVATIIVAKWENQFDAHRAHDVLYNTIDPSQEITLEEPAGVL